MAKLSIEELIAAFKELSLVEVSEFVKAFEEARPHVYRTCWRGWALFSAS